MKTFLFSFLLIFGYSTSNAQIKIGQGVTSPADWVDYNTTGIYVDVDTKSCEFTTTPHYLVTLESISNKGFHWYISGVPSVYNATSTGFRVYLRWTDAPSDLPTVGSLNFPNPLRASTAADRDWVIRWTAIEMQDCSSSRLENNELSKVFSGAFGPEGDMLSSDKKENGIGNHSENDLKVFPIPGNKVIKVQSKGEVNKYEIYDLNSRLLGTYYNNTINIEKFPKGNYILKTFMKSGEVITKQFIK
ncbi:T9SS type A sorting domain-containing protein [Aquimarina sp. MMG015]|uniref:T9SS type A sorting domain-containing protein n=1 Tax=Aquimarina sp. MMG015 TaxID=2822689 RepID=UPI001B3A1904|nr:T9SS type A sorting domain-containing protein [Aquimarina sp. MMG015]MBQ4803990.1 T9SS type A sorting domain-containing protein [Aquimarina sp. MMG015]